MSPIQYALSEIAYAINPKILQMAFTPPERFRFQQTIVNNNTIEDRIRDKVIDGRVRNLINLRGSQEIVISLSGLPLIQEENSVGWHCHIPLHLTNGRRIVGVRSLYMGLGTNAMGVVNTATMMGYGNGMGCGKDLNLQMAEELMKNNSPLALNHTNAVYLVDENTIYCEDVIIQGGMMLRCTVESDEEFSFLTGPYKRPFAKLCVLATKAYIYNELDIKVDQGQMISGTEVGRIREWIDKYSDAEELLQEFIDTEWTKIQIMADKPKRHNYLKLLTSPF